MYKPYQLILSLTPCLCLQIEDSLAVSYGHLSANVIVGLFLVQEGAKVDEPNYKGIRPCHLQPSDVTELLQKFARDKWWVWFHVFEKLSCYLKLLICTCVVAMCQSSTRFSHSIKSFHRALRSLGNPFTGFPVPSPRPIPQVCETAMNTSFIGFGTEIAHVVPHIP